MKRFHVHVAVSDLEQSTRFYSAMFGMPPTVHKIDYAKWMLDEPRLNFAISERTGALGVNHLGFQAESAEELEDIHARLQTADTAIAAEKSAECCYAKSDKYWVKDPTGIAWESFLSLDTIPFYGEQSHKNDSGADKATAGGCGTACFPANAKTGTAATLKPIANACCGS